VLKSEKNGYRDVEYTITALGGDKWKWAFYPKKEYGDSAHRGEVAGTEVQAVAACKSAIDAWHDGRTSAQ
jgi:hypothetical protein